MLLLQSVTYQIYLIYKVLNLGCFFHQNRQIKCKMSVKGYTEYSSKWLKVLKTYLNLS